MSEPRRTSEEVRLRGGLVRVVERAQREAAGGAPASMVAIYVDLEARHVLAGHLAGYGVDCEECSKQRHEGVPIWSVPHKARS